MHVLQEEPALSKSRYILGGFFQFEGKWKTLNKLPINQMVTIKKKMCFEQLLTLNKWVFCDFRKAGYLILLYYYFPKEVFNLFF